MEAPAVLVRELGVEQVGARLAFELGEVIQLTLTGPLDPTAGQDFPCHNLLSIAFANGRI